MILSCDDKLDWDSLGLDWDSRGTSTKHSTNAINRATTNNILSQLAAESEIQSVNVLRPDVPHWLADMISRCLRDDSARLVQVRLPALRTKRRKIKQQLFRRMYERVARPARGFDT